GARRARGRSARQLADLDRGPLADRQPAARRGDAVKVAVAIGASLALAACVRGANVTPIGSATRISDELATRWLTTDAEPAKAQGAGPAIVLATGAGAPGDTIGGRVAVGTADCSLFLARGSRSIEDLDLFVYGDDGTLLAGDETGNQTASTLVCPP